jgi:hypothetical protein
MAVLPQEYTLVKNKQMQNVMSFRKGKSFLVPYLKMDLTTNLLKEIKIGPCAFPDHSIASVNLLLRNLDKGLGPFEASRSRKPYRYW